MSNTDEKEISNLVSQFMQGDFTARVKPDSQLSRDMNKLGEYLEQIIRTSTEGGANTCMGVFDVISSITHMSQDISQMEERTFAVAAATEEMAATVEQIVTSSDQGDEAAQRAMEAAQEGAGSVHNAVDVMCSLKDSAANVMKEVEELAHFSNEIGAIVSSIQKIAGQTNMLALNATIEAARAGDAGRGFAVVAGEVKELSNQTAKAASEISEKIRTLQNEIKEVVNVMGTNLELADRGSAGADLAGSSMQKVIDEFREVSQTMEHIKHASHDQSLASREIAERTSELSGLVSSSSREISGNVQRLQAFEKLVVSQIQYIAQFKAKDAVISLAKSDHMLWKKRLMDMLVGLEKIEPEDVTDHHNCRLGKWYYAQGQSDFGHNSSFIALEKSHAQVHALAKSAVTKFKSGDKNGAIADVDAIATPSSEVVALLTKLQN